MNKSPDNLRNSESEGDIGQSNWSDRVAERGKVGNLDRRLLLQLIEEHLLKKEDEAVIEIACPRPLVWRPQSARPESDLEVVVYRFGISGPADRIVVLDVVDAGTGQNILHAAVQASTGAVCHTDFTDSASGDLDMRPTVNEQTEWARRFANDTLDDFLIDLCNKSAIPLPPQFRKLPGR